MGGLLKEESGPNGQSFSALSNAAQFVNLYFSTLKYRWPFVLGKAGPAATSGIAYGESSF